jgi:hypothetical protein
LILLPFTEHTQTATPGVNGNAVETLKQALICSICALWLYLTPKSNEMHEDVKNYFYESLQKCADNQKNTPYNGDVALVVHQMIESFKR